MGEMGEGAEGAPRSRGGWGCFQPLYILRWLFVCLAAFHRCSFTWATALLYISLLCVSLQQGDGYRSDHIPAAVRIMTHLERSFSSSPVWAEFIKAEG